MKLKQIISGGQTGTDQAALQAAIDSGLSHGGWCPPGRICENGKIPDQFDLKETPSERDPSASDIPRSQRTIWNVRDSDASLIFMRPEHKDKGTELAIQTFVDLGKPYLIIDPANGETVAMIKKWLNEMDIEILSIGGPGEHSNPGIYNTVYDILIQIFTIEP